MFSFVLRCGAAWVTYLSIRPGIHSAIPHICYLIFRVRSPTERRTKSVARITFAMSFAKKNAVRSRPRTIRCRFRAANRSENKFRMLDEMR